MTRNGEFDWFRLLRLKGIGSKALWGIYDYITSEAISISDLLSKENIEIPKPFKKFTGNLNSLLAEQDYDKVQEEFDYLLNKRITVLHPHHEMFPKAVLNYGRDADIPPIIFSRGYLPLTQTLSVAIVGSRNVEDKGLCFAQWLATELAKDGFNVVSGYAKGVDFSAHMSALQAEGTTTIVLSLGILNWELKKDIKPLVTGSNTLAISQFQPRERWTARNAMARNKLVCALSKALVVIASGQEYDDLGRMSGTFDAAKSALAMSIPVFVVSPRFYASPPIGNADLIKLGCYELMPNKALNQIISKVDSSRIRRNPPDRQKDESSQMALFGGS
jgi:DNA processing protein